jgi:hypothetical protein
MDLKSSMDIGLIQGEAIIAQEAPIQAVKLHQEMIFLRHFLGHPTLPQPSVPPGRSTGLPSEEPGNSGL